MGRAVIASRIPGCVDAVEDGVTGLLVPPRDAAALCDAMLRLGRNAQLRQRLGDQGRERVVRFFERERIWEALAGCYDRLTRAAREGR
jgi:glycosyltransferase involved in cell wall biosynthesis